MTPEQIQERRDDAATIRRIISDIYEMKRKHPEYHALNMFDTTTLRITAMNLDDDADQEERMNADREEPTP